MTVANFDHLSSQAQEARMLTVDCSSIGSYGPGTASFQLGEAIKKIHKVCQRTNRFLGPESKQADTEKELLANKGAFSKAIANLLTRDFVPARLIDTTDDTTGLAQDINKAFNELKRLLTALHRQAETGLRNLIKQAC
ncbi:MAG: hypothetical protein OXU45_04185 [Candidatus Melainabacteria bacterium]|nr:hypothetical protein [Candidatus Melainabacteria bacterium]